MVTREAPPVKAAEATTPWRESRDICALATQRTFLTQEEMLLAQTGQCCLLLPKKGEVTQDTSGFILNDSPCYKTSLQIKNRAKINIGVRLNMNLRGKMTQMICLTTRHGKDNGSIALKKKCWLSIHNKAKSEHFAVTSAKRVTVFQASLKVVREEAGAQLSKKR